MIKLYEPKIYKEDINLVNKTLKEGWVSGNSPIVKDFENKIREFCGVKYCLATSSGTTGLHLALLGSGLKSGDEVLTPSLSYIATANAVKYFGGKPVFIDVNKNDFQIDTKKIEEKINNRTKAIIPVHLYGGVPNLKEIRKVAKKYKLKIIHDAAEALGSTYEEKQSVGFDDVGIISFFPNKVITTGEGGAILTNNKTIYEKCLKLRSQGLAKNGDYIHDVIGYNYRISALSAALGYNQVDKIFDHVNLKYEIFETYKNKLSEHNIQFQTFEKNVQSSYWLTVAVFPEKIKIKKLQEYLYKNQIETRRIFYPIHLQKPYFSKKSEKFEISEELYDRGLCLPTYPGLKKKEIEYIVDKIIKYID